jgi:para-aminobenzoate synthetase component 1
MNSTLIEKLNFYGKHKIPFLFIISFDLQSWDIVALDELKDDISYSIDDTKTYSCNTTLEILKPDFHNYKIEFEKVISHIKAGDTYIFNLTTKTPILNDLSLKYIYQNCNAKYKLLYRDKFLSFSPETFIKIKGDKISSYPMKGTIDACIKDAKNTILNDTKELAEHTMIVDLIRNDLGIIASNIEVEKFRYIHKIKAGKKELYQVSSKITGSLQTNWCEHIGDIITSLLPAGSITGTPKKSTVNLINQIESYDREFFTGVWGIFDGENIDSSILIRFIQNDNGVYSYKSGGGITIDSDCTKEYDEMIDKIYIP